MLQLVTDGRHRADCKFNPAPLASTCQNVPLPLPYSGDEPVTNFVFRASSGGCQCMMMYENGQWHIRKDGKTVSRKVNLLNALSELERFSGLTANDFRAV